MMKLALSCFFTAVLLCSGVHGAESAPVDPAVYGALPTVSYAEISPDGKTVAQIQAMNGVRAIAFYDLEGEKKPIGVELGDVDARGIVWGGPDHAIAWVSASKTFAWSHGLETHEIWRMISVDRRSADFSYLFSGAARFDFYFGSGEILSRLADEPDAILMGHYSPHGEWSIYKIDLNSGKERLHVRGDYSPNYDKFAGTVDWVVDAAGNPAVRIDYYEKDEERRFYTPADVHGGWALASAIPEKLEDDIQAEAYGLVNNAGNLIHVEMSKDGYRGLYVFDVDRGGIEKTAFAPNGYDIDDAMVDPASAAVVGVRYIDDFRRTHFLIPGLEKIQKSLEAAIPNGNPVITSWSDDFTKFMVRVTYTDHPDQFFLFDKEKKTFSMFSTSYAELDGHVAATKEKYDYVASDGLKIPGYLTVPSTALKKNMPLVVLPHGGPWERDNQSFDWWAFFYAARGYLVYQPNFRGSSGYGEDFRAAGDGQWGRKMQDDINEGVRALIADGIVDPARICIAGDSYGGYAALAGATMAPELYACAVSVNGVSNIAQHLADQRDWHGDEDDYMKKRVGNRFDPEQMRGVSPVNLVTSSTSPVLLIHAEHDTVVPVGQSRIMRNELQRAGVEHEFVLMKGEDHWLSTAAARTETLAQSIKFIDRHIGAD